MSGLVAMGAYSAILELVILDLLTGMSSMEEFANIKIVQIIGISDWIRSVYQPPEKIAVMELVEDLQKENLDVLTLATILPKVTRPHEFVGANPGKVGLWDTVHYCTALVICYQQIAKCKS
jgi:hypothetical protein